MSQELNLPIAILLFSPLIKSENLLVMLFISIDIYLQE